MHASVHSLAATCGGDEKNPSSHNLWSNVRAFYENLHNKKRGGKVCFGQWPTTFRKLGGLAITESFGW